MMRVERSIGPQRVENVVLLVHPILRLTVARAQGDPFMEHVNHEGWWPAFEEEA